MISKEYRLTERELRKVLSRKKPFFSYIGIMNTNPNKIEHGRCGILLSSKCTKGSVNRNFWRRKFYDLMSLYLDGYSLDLVFVPKKGITLDYKNQQHLIDFEQNIFFLSKKIKDTYIK